MAIPAAALLREIRKAFTDTVTTMRTLHSAVQIRPEADDVIQISEKLQDTVDIECKPVVCSVPERANATSASLYIVFSGKLCLRASNSANDIFTDSYGTNFAYFKTESNSVTHAFGGHYDFAASDIAHPRAHLQLASHEEMWSDATERFPSVSDRIVGGNPMKDILNRVRAPSAQMDFLSFMVQIAADHLVYEKSEKAVRSTFNNLTAKCAPFLGYPVTPAHETWQCHRAMHWYPQS